MSVNNGPLFRAACCFSVSLYAWSRCKACKRVCWQGVAGILIGVFVAENTGIIIRCFQFPLRVCQLLLSPSAQCGCTNMHKTTHTHTPASYSPKMPASVTHVQVRCNVWLDDLLHAIWHLLFSLSMPFLSSPHSQSQKKDVYIIVKLFSGWGVEWPDALWVCVVCIYTNVCTRNSLGATVLNAQEKQYHTPVFHLFLVSHLIWTHPLGATGVEVRDGKRRQIITVCPQFILAISVDNDATALLLTYATPDWLLWHVFGLSELRLQYCLVVAQEPPYILNVKKREM